MPRSLSSTHLGSIVRRALLAESRGDYSWVPRLDPRKRYIISSDLIGSVRRVPIEQQLTRMKPEGLWYGVGEDWIEHLKSHWELQRDHRYLYEVVIDPARVLQVKTIAETINFVREFGKREREIWTSGEGMGLVDWKSVAKRYLGVELAPHWAELRTGERSHRLGLDWYSSWDVGSGCVWDPSGFKSLQLIATSADANELGRSGQMSPASHASAPDASGAEAGGVAAGFDAAGHFGDRAAGALLTTGRKVMLLLRSESVTEPGTWGIPGGKMEEDEYPEDTVARETLEETGIDLARVKHTVLGNYAWRSPTSSFTYTAQVLRVPEGIERVRVALNWESDDVKWVDDAWIREHRGLLHPGLQQYIDHLLPIAFDQRQGSSVRDELVRKSKIVAGGDWNLEGEASSDSHKGLPTGMSEEEYTRRSNQAYRRLGRDIKRLWADEVRMSGGSFDGVTFVHWGQCDDIESMIKNPDPAREISACPYLSWPVVPLELERFESKFGTAVRNRSVDCRLGLEVRGRITFCANADLDSNTSRFFGVDSRRKYFGQESSGYSLQNWPDVIVTDKSQLRPNSDFVWRAIDDPDEFNHLSQSSDFHGEWPEALVVNWRPVSLIYVRGPNSLQPDEVFEIAQDLPVKNTRGLVLRPW